VGKQSQTWKEDNQINRVPAIEGKEKTKKYSTSAIISLAIGEGASTNRCQRKTKKNPKIVENLPTTGRRKKNRHFRHSPDQPSGPEPKK